MNAEMVHDLAAYGRGELSRADVVARYGVEALPALAAHDRMEVAASPSAFDVDAGWTRIEAQIAPMASVVALAARRRRPRSVVLAAAAALMLVGSAFAAIGPRLFEERGMIPAVHEVPSGGRSVVTEDGDGDQGDRPDREGMGADEARPRNGGSDTDATGPGSGSESRDGSAGDRDGADPKDDPNDRDQGKGNDGDHDDRGGGNDGREGVERDTGSSSDPSGSKSETRGTSKGRSKD